MKQDDVYEMLLMDLNEHAINAFAIRDTPNSPIKAIQIGLKHMICKEIEVEISIHKIHITIESSKIYCNWNYTQHSYLTNQIADFSDPQCSARVRMFIKKVEKQLKYQAKAQKIAQRLKTTPKINKEGILIEGQSWYDHDYANPEKLNDFGLLWGDYYRNAIEDLIKKETNPSEKSQNTNDPEKL